ncbi:MAG: type I methionyl aminopeptidase [Brevinemataceae bacterium]
MTKNSLQLKYMQHSGKVIADVFNYLKTIMKPGITGLEIDAVVEDRVRSHGASPAFKNYQPFSNMKPFPYTICWSVNEQVIHGFPSDRPIIDGDVISIDLGVELNGYYSDSAYTFLVGNVDPEVRIMSDLTQEALRAAIQICRPGNYIGDIGKAVESVIKKQYGIVREFCGHGIGKNLHEKPSIVNYYDPKRRGPKIEEGMILAIEPMINLGTEQVKVMEDGWTIVTKDGKPSCHWEHTIAVTKDDPIIITDRGDFPLYR